MTAAVQRLTLRELNRATLARQHLLKPSVLSPLAMIEHLVGLQAQDPKAPFIGLWTRIAEFDFAEPGRLLEERAVVRSLTMRGTVHLLMGRDALGLRPLLQPAMDREFKGIRAKRLAEQGADSDAITERARELLAEAPRTARELGELIVADHPDWPESLLEHVSAVPRVRLPTVQIPPRGVWGQSGQPVYRLLEDWLDAPMQPYPLGTVVKRYLAAFGPASVNDLQAWCGLTRLRPAFEALGDELLRFEGPGGQSLYDLPDAPRPDGDTPAPVRILPEFDNLLVSYADRSRVISDDRRKAMSTLNGMVPGTVLVDGVVTALCKTPLNKDGARARIMPLEKLSKGVRDEIEQEATRLLAAMGGRYVGAPVVFEDPGDRWNPG